MMTFAQLNYSIHEQEMLALKHCLLHKRRHHLDMQTFTIFMDNRALSSLKTNTYQGYEAAHAAGTGLFGRRRCGTWVCPLFSGGPSRRLLVDTANMAADLVQIKSIVECCQVAFASWYLTVHRGYAMSQPVRSKVTPTRLVASRLASWSVCWGLAACWYPVCGMALPCSGNQKSIGSWSWLRLVSLRRGPIRPLCEFLMELILKQSPKNCGDSI
ncbi:hypothetical protein VTP01DRAFT_2286 [Rhizomucor pusillus]|uniref:uncharacterized protein n=1 Tax=Rhizomucor pusillus TaxID=4840 RepID=UPI003742392E